MVEWKPIDLLPQGVTKPPHRVEPTKDDCVTYVTTVLDVDTRRPRSVYLFWYDQKSQRITKWARITPPL